MGLEWIDTWAGLAGFVAVLAWLNGQHRQTRKQMERLEAGLRAEIGKVEAGLKEEIGRVESSLDTKIDKVEAGLKGEINKVEAGLKAEINKVESGLKAEIRASEQRILAFVNKRLDDFKDFVLARAEAPRSRRSLATPKPTSAQTRRTRRRRSR